MEILFVTGNAGKVATPTRVFAEHGIFLRHLDPEKAAKPFKLDEIQADTAGQVAARKAMDAFVELGKPLIVEDAAFHIPIFNGWPGPFAKQAIEGIGPEGFCKLMWERPWVERKCYFREVVACMSGNLSEPVCFCREIHGMIAPELRGEYHAMQKSRLFSVFIPDGSPEDKTLAELSVEEMRDLTDRVEGMWNTVAAWAKKNI